MNSMFLSIIHPKLDEFSFKKDAVSASPSLDLTSAILSNVSMKKTTILQFVTVKYYQITNNSVLQQLCLSTLLEMSIVDFVFIHSDRN